MARPSSPRNGPGKNQADTGASDALALLLALLGVPEQLRALEQEIKRLNERTANLEFKGRVVYDVAALRDMGVPRNKAYALMERFGQKSGDHGRYLISQSALEEALRDHGRDRADAAGEPEGMAS